MVNFYTTTDRTHRYHKRCNEKQVLEMKYIIKKKTDEVHYYIEHNRKIANLLSRTNGFNRMIYNAYSGLYKKYTNVIQDFDKLRVTQRDTEAKLKETEELYENLEYIYNEKVSECEKLKRTNNLEDCEIKE